MRDIAPDVKRNTDIVDSRLVVIVMDDATIPFDLAMIKSAREIGRLAIERLGPNDLACIVFTRDNRNAQEFTDDRARLLKAIDAFESGSRVIGISQGAQPGPAMPNQIQLFESTVDVSAAWRSRWQSSATSQGRDLRRRRRARRHAV